MQPERVWSPQQKVIYQNVEEEDGNLIILARAGCGKTTTLQHAALLMAVGQTRVGVVAFNKDIKEELRNRLPARIDVLTTHGLGLRALGPAWEPKVGKLNPEKSRFREREIIKQALPTLIYDDKVVVADVTKLMRLSKARLPETADDFRHIMNAYDCSPAAPITEEQYIAWVQAALEISRTPNQFITYDDMCYVPAYFKMRTGRYDNLLVDEGQDLNKAQRILTKNGVKDKNSRIIVCGDDRQALYTFRGADENSINEYIEDLNAKVLPLTRTYRCPRLVVELVNEFVPDFEAAPDAPEGFIKTGSETQMRTHWRSGDFVLSRTNAPLPRLCLAALSAGIPAHIQGKDIGGTLSTLIDKSKSRTTEELAAWLLKWSTTEIKRLTAAEEDEDKLEEVYDKMAAINAIAEGLEFVKDVQIRIDKLFDDNAGKGIMFSSVHKAKGLEADCVWMLDNTFRPGKNIEEDNIYYVAATRTKHDLYLITLDKKGKKKNAEEAVENEEGV